MWRWAGAGGGDAGSPRTGNQEQGAQGAAPAPGGGNQELAAGAQLMESNQTHPTREPQSCGASGARQDQGWDSFFPPGGGGGAGRKLYLCRSLWRDTSGAEAPLF